MDKRYKATRIQVDFADGSKLVAEGEEARIMWPRLEAGFQILAEFMPFQARVRSLVDRVCGPEARLHKILPNGQEEPCLEG